MKWKRDEYRTFQQEWTEELALIERAGSAMCPVAKLEGMLVMHCMTNAVLEYQFYL